MAVGHHHNAASLPSFSWRCRSAGEDFSHQGIKRPGSSGSVRQRTFPYGKHSPAKAPERGCIFGIAAAVAFQLVLPELASSAGHSPLLAAMGMPKAAMHEHHYPVSWQNQVWPSRQRSIVEPVPQASCMQIAADHQLGSRIGSAYSAHSIAAFFRGKSIGHGFGTECRLPEDGVLPSHIWRTEGENVSRARDIRQFLSQIGFRVNQRVWLLSPKGSCLSKAGPRLILSDWRTSRRHLSLSQNTSTPSKKA